MAHFYYIKVNTPDEHTLYGPFENPEFAHYAVHVIASRQKSLEVVSTRPSQVTLKDSDGNYYKIRSELFHSTKQSRIDYITKRMTPFKG